MEKKVLKEVSGDLKLLYVEDEPDTRKHLADFLSHFFKEVHLAANGKEALEVCRVKSFDLVLTDIEMPVMNGIEMIEQIRRFDRKQHIVALSGTSDIKNLVKLLNNHICGFIPKPFEMKQAMDTLARVCSNIQDEKMLGLYMDELEGLYSKVNTRIEACKQQEGKSGTVSVADNLELWPTAAVSAILPETENLYKDYFRQLLPEDMDELRDLISDMDGILAGSFAASGDGNAEYINKLGEIFIRYGSVLLHYQFFSDVGISITELGKSLSAHSDHVAHNAREYVLLIGEFCTVLQNFLREVWEQDAGNPKFFNDSIVNDANMVIGQITPSTVGQRADDLVFF